MARLFPPGALLRGRRGKMMTVKLRVGRCSVKVADVLRSKGGTVETVGAHEPLDAAVRRMASRGIGSLVVTGSDGTLVGVLSERDVVRAMAASRVVGRTVGDAVDGRVVTCAPEETLTDVMALMTRTRRRHVPVVADGRLVGMISIGDAVKARLDELGLETTMLREIVLGHQTPTRA
jgi:CBS domain-containing protein